MSRRRDVLLGLVLAPALGMVSEASAWSSLGVKWQGPVPYALNERGSNDLGGFAGTEPIVNQAFNEWATPACNDLVPDYQGSTNGGASRGSNTIEWIENGWSRGNGVIGTTGIGGGRGGIQASMQMNGTHWTWVDGDPSRGEVDAFSITLHEAGHYYGLGHSNAGGATMRASYSGGVLSLNDDDVEGICTIYERDPGADDCTVTGCPPGQSCLGGSCIDDVNPPPPDPPEGGVCASCSTDDDCPGLCLLYPDDQSYCAVPCEDDSDCDGARCLPTSEGSDQCVRVGPDGPDCSGGADPNRPPSRPGAGPNPCPAGQDRDPTSGACGPPPVGGLGDLCATNDQCSTEICAENEGRQFCTSMCDDETPCPAGFDCRVGLCHPRGGATGEACESGVDCPNPVGPSGGPNGVRHLRGGCDVRSGVPPSFPGGLLLVAGVLAWAVRRRKPAAVGARPTSGSR